ncbi:MAG TPA: amidohydrolase family protein [Gemmatimonadales bacterium]|jgi:imidazolonepropionase-like amidohydrolase|nr:amidohydrolase family protein [Gemmatimonadales bacterium]
MIAFLLAQTIAITGGTVYPVSGPKIENATVLIRDGRIAAVGTNVAVPAGATRIDASGKWITPGLIDGAGQMGLREISAVQNTNESALRGDEVAAAFNVAEGINPASMLIPVNRVEGITTTLAVPNGDLIWGQAVLIDLDGTTIEAMVATRSPVAMVADLSEGSKSAGGGSRAGVAQRLRRVFNDALEFSRRGASYQRAQNEQLAASAADLEALLPVLRGQIPLLAVANRRSDIETALRIAREYKLRLILAGAAEGWEIADKIAAAGVPVVVQPMDNIPSFDALGVRYENAALLAKAGVKVSLMETQTENSRNLRQQAGNAVAYGMTWDQALRAVTLAPAEAFGVGGQYGSLDVGKVANVVVWTGDPFEFSTGVEHVFIRGKEISLRSRQTELLDRYRTLPPKY